MVDCTAIIWKTCMFIGFVKKREGMVTMENRCITLPSLEVSISSHFSTGSTYSFLNEQSVLQSAQNKIHGTFHVIYLAH